MRTLCARIAVLLSLLILPSAGALQDQGSRVAEPGKMWALVIGISNYTKAEPLQFAASDAQSFADFLQSPRGGAIPRDHMIALTEDRATRTEIVVALESMQEKVQKGDNVYIYIAGHGYIRQRMAYFIPSDGDLRLLAPTSVPFVQLKEMIEAGLAQARTRVVITDICHAGRIGTAPTDLEIKIQNLINEDFKNLKGGGGTFLNLLASRPSEASWERDDLAHGVFTHALLEALSGKAVNPGETIADALRVVRYVQSEVPKYTAGRQHPMANEDFDPNLPLAFLDKPGPAAGKDDGQAEVELTNCGKAGYIRFQWTDPRTQSAVVRQISADQATIRIVALPPGELEFSFFDAGDQPHRLKIKIGPGKNSFDLAQTRLNLIRPPDQLLGRLASVSPILPSRTPRLGRILAESPPAEARDATLSMRLVAATEVYLDGVYFGAGGGGRQIQLEGLTPGAHILRFVQGPDREQRFRLKLFAGRQIFDPPSGELRSSAEQRSQAFEEALPAGLSAAQQEWYRRFFISLREDRLISPSGESAWDYYQRLRESLPPATRDVLKNRLIVAMGNRAQRTILKYLRGGDIRWSAGVFEEGAALMERVRQLFKTTPGFESQQSFFLGRALIERGQYSRAVRELQHSVDLDPEAGHAYNSIGLAYWKQNLLDRAISPLQRAIDLSPQWTYPRNTLALIYLEQRLYADAERMYLTSIQADREDSSAYHGLGQLYLLLGRIQEAEVQIRLALEFNPGNAYACETLGRLRRSQRRFTEAEEAFRLAIRMEPDETSFQVSLADLLSEMGRSAEAGQILQRAADSDPGNFQVVQTLTRYLQNQKRYPDAEAVFGRALKLSPEDANLLVIHSDFLREQHREREAERQLRKAQQIAPDNAYVHHALALHNLALKKVAEAENEISLASKADPRLAAPHRLLGQIRFEQRRYGEALDAYRRALELTIDAGARQEIGERVALAEMAFTRDGIDRAGKLFDGGKKAEAWSAAAAALRSVPLSRDLRNCLLQFYTLAPSSADRSLLPPGMLAEVFGTRFWAQQQQAVDLWQKGDRAPALRTFARAFDEMSLAELRVLGSTEFNLGNDTYGLHQIVYRWCLRLLEERNYSGALDLIESAMRRRVFAAIPDLHPLTIDSLMIRPGMSDPKTIADYDIAHHPDRRAHEIYAAALAALGKMDDSARYLPALEQIRPDLPARLLAARALQAEKRWNDASGILKAGLVNPQLFEQGGPLAEAYVFLAEIQCQAGACDSARATLRDGQRALPGNKLIEAALKKLK